MNVKLISYSQPSDELIEQDLDNIQDLIAYCARVSNPNNQYNSETSTKLLNFLARHAHWSPFEMVSMCLEIETTRDIARQILRHRSFSFQEFSQRYANPTKDLEFVVREARFQDSINRQNSVEIDDDKMSDRVLKEMWDEKQANVIQTSREAYEWAIENGIAKEQARAVLPEGNIMSRMYMNGTVRSWIHYIQLRSGNGTQKEHAEIAKLCAKVIADIFPLSKEYISE